MARRLRPVGLDFIEHAPTRLAFTARAAAAPEAVYRALADEVTGWPAWFRAVTLARPTGGGAGREIRLVGGVRFQETVVASDPGLRYAYRVDETNAPGMSALVEEWLLAPGPGADGTLVRWTFAADGPAPVRLALAAARPGLGRSFRTAVRALDTRLAARTAP
ncbi:SRPBCC family protein [Streptomyces lavendulae]|uniref:SRPBCC family protein n=1 Tax=Streptomyces lavendulae TaxID=1914 RepID=UPI0024A17F5E|nr:SRPBCC family protein [Streptomyces lavendulae]GLX16733.1 polyketide cyclase [Streptomyces lavendulae subsp. lavendulae]GLX25355.1 polyketide cyclase [Streptomyces lavendulae subsp. lavendulae]